MIGASIWTLHFLQPTTVYRIQRNLATPFYISYFYNSDKCNAWAHFKCAGFRPAVENHFIALNAKNARKNLSNSSSYIYYV